MKTEKSIRLLSQKVRNPFLLILKMLKELEEFEFSLYNYSRTKEKRRTKDFLLPLMTNDCHQLVGIPTILSSFGQYWQLGREQRFLALPFLVVFIHVLSGLTSIGWLNRALTR